ncbi:MAG: hypothetical protein KGN34_10260 [Sphingomonadales bacterium]|nr:hypothetical protein [Sphingomonadales bacterium]
MKTYIFLISAALLLNGCDMIRMVLPRHGATDAQARAAMQKCGIIPDSIGWTVREDGTFAFGRKSANAAPMTETQDECLVRWAEDNRIKIAFIGWETGPR